MVFNSLQYIVFLFVVVMLHHFVLRSVHQQKWLLFIAGSIFYAAWSPGFLLLLYATIIVDWAVGVVLAGNSQHRRLILSASFAVNIGVLAFFKYTDFFAANIEAIASMAGLHLALPRLGIELPLGISFYTFLS